MNKALVRGVIRSKNRADTLFITTLLVIICLTSCVNVPKKGCSWTDPHNVQLRIDQMNQCIESAELKTYTDSTYNVHVFYPSCFKVIKKEEGKARFHAFFHEGSMDLYLKVDSINEGTNYYYNNEYHLSNDSTIKYLARGNDCIVISGPHFIKKLFKVNNLYMEYKLHYSMSHGAEVSERLINIVKEWNPIIADVAKEYE